MPERNNHKQSNRWRQFKLADLIDVKHGFAFKGEFFSDDPTDDILLTPGNFCIGGGFKADKFKYYTGSYPSEYVLSPGDIIVTMTDLSKNGDTLGYPAKIPDEKGKRYLHNQRLGLVVFKDKAIDRNFLYWLMRSKTYQRFIVNSASGSTVKHTSPNRIKEYVFDAPANVTEQRKIAKILSDLEEKIVINHQMNKILEAIAQAFFKRWFVDFEFPGHEKVKFVNRLPEEWETRQIGDVLELAYGKALKEERRQPWKIPVYGSNGQVGWHNESLAKGPGIIVGRKGNPGVVTWAPTDFFPIDTCFYVVIKDVRLSMYYLFHALSNINLASLGADSAVPGLNRNIAYNTEILTPSAKVTNEYDKIAKTLFDQILVNDQETDILSAIRDSLLPRLMSGKIRISP